MWDPLVAEAFRGNPPDQIELLSGYLRGALGLADGDRLEITIV